MLPLHFVVTAMLNHAETLVSAALLIVSTCVVFIPELRVPEMRLALLLLVLANAALYTWRLHVSGMLGLTLKGVYHSRRRPEIPLLSTVATLMSVVAIVIGSMH